MRLVRLAGRVETSPSFDSPSGHGETCRGNSGEHRRPVVGDGLSANPPDTPARRQVGCSGAEMDIENSSAAEAVLSG
jgi:hypothetical protein